MVSISNNDSCTTLGAAASADDSQHSDEDQHREEGNEEDGIWRQSVSAVIMVTVSTLTLGVSLAVLVVAKIVGVRVVVVIDPAGLALLEKSSQHSQR